MSNWLHHETLHRAPETMARLRGRTVTVCGAGALGSHVLESLARTGVDRLRVIDFDRVEERNLSTQSYHRGDVGGLKAKLLAGELYRAVGVRVDARPERLRAENVGKLLAESELVVDVFDNSGSRRLVTEHCRQEALPCVHAGLAAGYGEVIWNERYVVPAPTGEDDCDYPLARNLVLLVASVTAELVLRWLDTGERSSFTVTLDDLAVRPLEG
ncbi:MAG: ThiF family adenylyltransferase [Acidobacteriota bacterium]